MSLKALIADGVATAFQSLGDLVEEAILTAPDTLDPVTEASVAGQSGGWFAVEAEFSLLEISGGDVKAGDLKVMAEDATKPFTPAPGYTFDFRGVSYHIHQADPVQGALWQLHLRRPN